ncbi:MAG: hypothetical protein JRN20_02985 [Nitrososphaerota archaeon]|nr:hypothetical protein [Nitrososphaerota archaeon]MDG6923627.1 hypothetical protein [Nitrososphaerota archaeon]
MGEDWINIRWVSNFIDSMEIIAFTLFLSMVNQQSYFIYSVALVKELDAPVSNDARASQHDWTVPSRIIHVRIA